MPTRTASSARSSGEPRPLSTRGSGNATASQSSATSPACSIGPLTSEPISERPHPVHVWRADSYIRTSSRSAASKKPIRQPSARSERANATSSVRLARTRVQPPAARNGSRRTTMHCPLAVARRGRGCQPSTSAGPTRYGIVAAIDGCRTRSAGVSQTNRGAALIRSNAPAASINAAISPDLGRVSASRNTTQSPFAASSPCCSAHALPAQPSGSSRPAITRAPNERASVAVPSVDRSSTTSTSPSSPRSAARHGPRRRSSSRAGMTIETRPVGRGAPRASGGRRRRPRARRPARTAAAIDCANNTGERSMSLRPPARWLAGPTIGCGQLIVRLPGEWSQTYASLIGRHAGGSSRDRSRRGSGVTG